MSSIDTSSEGGGGHKKGPGVKKAKKLSTRVDMTPMVDLGFLLITFFIFTATMSSPKAMDLRMPKDVDDPEKQNEAKESGALTIMLGKDNHVFYYEGQLKVEEGQNNFKSSTFKEIRDVIIDKRQRVMAAHQSKGHDKDCEEIWAKHKGDKTSCLDKDLVVIIKPTADATYMNTVNILDEMTINGVKTYAMVKILQVEDELIKKSEGTPVPEPANK
jgi:biopolymer transport protein ExbD